MPAPWLVHDGVTPGGISTTIQQHTNVRLACSFKLYQRILMPFQMKRMLAITSIQRADNCFKLARDETFDGKDELLMIYVQNVRLDMSHESSTGFWNEMLTEDIEYKVARENQEQRHYEKNGYKNHCAKSDREEAEPIRSHMQDDRLIKQQSLA